LLDGVLKLKFIKRVVVLSEVARPTTSHQVLVGVVAILCKWLNVVKGDSGQEPDSVVTQVGPLLSESSNHSASE
jgi:hypothetical protein